MNEAVAEARRYRDSHGHEIVATVAELFSIPNVASDPGLDRTAIWIRDHLAARGVRAAITQIPGAAPVVFGRIDGEPGGPTLGVYAHFDGQPVDESRWSSPPFVPTLRSGRVEDGAPVLDFPGAGDLIDPRWRIYARASSDDRGTIGALLAALDARAGRPPRATVVFLLEGEEEQGSPHLPEYLGLLADRLQSDIWLICDGPVHQSRRPQVVFGVRGIADLEIEVYGPAGDLHSGHYGNWAPNPAAALAELLASMRDEEGRPTVAGLEGPEPEPAAVAAARAVPPPGDLGYPEPDGPGIWERNLYPLLNVRGIRSGDVGDASRNVVPASAVASIDLRLVAGQDPAEAIAAVRRHVAARGYHLVDAAPERAVRAAHRRIARVHGRPWYPGVRTAPDHPAARSVLAAAAAAGDVEPLVVPSFGGSVPIHHFEEALGNPVAILPIANHDNNQHGPDENLRIGNLWYGMDLFAALLG
jgi:acetylornithine deacetylase/succinyl-diaminopimelate desuccinylase-like protein